MTGSAVHQLAEALLDATERGDITWLAGDGSDESEMLLRTRVRSGGATIHPKDWDWAPPYVLALLGPDGNEVNSWNSDSVPEDTTKLIARLYGVAKSSMTKRVLEAMLEELAPLPPTFDMDEEPF